MIWILFDCAYLDNYLPKADAAALCTKTFYPAFFTAYIIPRTVIGLI